MLIVLSGGGTAGHINPALALADVLKQRGCEVRFAGTPTGVEARLVREAGIPFTPFEAQGFNRNHPLTLPKAVLTIQKSTTLARRWFDEIRPDAVVGFGGKSIINPRQIPIVHEIFTPTQKDIIFAEKVVKEIDSKKALGIGVFTVDGKMIDIAFYDGAKRTIDLAKASGVYKGDL